jgi:hypothetical protein
MNRIKTLTLAAGIALAATSMAHAADGVAGKWTYKVGLTGTACSVTLNAQSNDSRSGTVTPAASCPSGLMSIGHWRSIGHRLSLISPSGDLVAILHAKDGNYTGKQIGGGRRVALSR